MISWDFMRFQSCHVCGFCGGIKASEHLRSVWTSKSSNLRISSQDLSGLNLRQRGDTDRSCGRHMRYEVSDSSDQIHWIDHWSVLNESIHHNSAWFSLSKCSRSGLSLGCVFFFRSDDRRSAPFPLRGWHRQSPVRRLLLSHIHMARWPECLREWLQYVDVCCILLHPSIIKRKQKEFRVVCRRLQARQPVSCKWIEDKPRNVSHASCSASVCHIYPA